MPFDVSFACPDWEEKLERGETPIPKLPLNQARADKAVRLFNALQLPDVPGTPPLADAGGAWFRDIVRNAFAAEHPDTGQPLVNEVFTLVPKKNSKTTYSAALGLTALLLWERPNAQMLILGPTQNVSERCFQQAHGMIKANPKLAKIFHVQEHLKKITRIKTGATLTVKTFDMSVVTGEIPALTIIDELHVLGAKNAAERVIGQITGGMVTNPAALLVYITTQSDTPPQGVFKTKLDYARRVRDGEITGAVNFLPVLYEFPERVQLDEKKPWLNPDQWALVTPNLGLSVNFDILKKLYATAKEEGPDSVITWASQHLNIQIGMGLHGDRWIGADYWPSARRDGLTLDRILEMSEVCVVGVDGGGLDDLLGAVVLGRHRDTKEWMAWGRAWADTEVQTRRKGIVAQLRDFERDGDLVFVDDLEQAYAEIAQICCRIRDAGLFPDQNGIGMDPEAVGSIIDALIEAGFSIEDIQAIGQGYKLHSAIKGAPVKLKNGKLVHGGQGLMTWCVGNAKTEARGNAVIVTKAVSGSGKIDPLMALFDAVMLMSWNPVAGRTRIRIPADYEVC